MSKLSKFKSSISPKEAAVLLSRLIDEEVTENDISMMYSNGWITARVNCFATIVKLTPLLDPKEHAKQVELGRYFMKPGEDCGLCVGFDIPADQVDVGDGGIAYVLRDDDGGFYALRDHATESFLNDTHDSMPYFEEGFISPSEIYELAESANDDKPVQAPKGRVRPNDNCISSVTLYNFPPGDDRPIKQAPAIMMQAAQEAPSFALAVAALVEIATSGETKNRNQSSLIDEILDNYDLRGLSKSNLEKMFSQANRKLTEAKAAKA